MFFPVQCWSSSLVLPACAFCLVTIYALFLRAAGHCATRNHTYNKWEFWGSSPQLFWGERPQHKSMCYSLKVPFWQVYSSCILGPGVCANETLLKSIFKMRISSYPTHLTPYLLFQASPAEGLSLYCFLCSSHPSSLATNFLTILAVSVQAYLPHSCLDLLN